MNLGELREGLEGSRQSDEHREVPTVGRRRRTVLSDFQNAREALRLLSLSDEKLLRVER